MHTDFPNTREWNGGAITKAVVELKRFTVYEFCCKRVPSHTYIAMNARSSHRIYGFSESENVAKAFSEHHDDERCARERDNGNVHTETADKRKKLAYSVGVDCVYCWWFSPAIRGNEHTFPRQTVDVVNDVKGSETLATLHTCSLSMNMWIMLYCTCYMFLIALTRAVYRWIMSVCALRVYMGFD